MIILVIFLLIYFVYLINLKYKRTLSNVGFVVLNKTHYLFLLIFFLTLIFSLRGIYLRGFWTSKIILWTIIMTSSIIWIFCRNSIKNPTEKSYFKLIFIFPSIFFLTWIFPPLGNQTFCEIDTYLGEYEKRNILYEDKDYKIAFLGGLCGHQGDYPVLLIKKGIFEIKEEKLTFDFREFEFNITKISNDSIKIDYINYENEKDSEIIRL